MDIIKHLRELRARATAGKWSQNIENSNYVHSERGDDRDPVGDCYDRTDAALICAAVNHLDLLLDVADAADELYALRCRMTPEEFDSAEASRAMVRVDLSVRALREARVK